MKNINRSTGMTLTEVMLAMALLASAFIPIIGVMGTSIKATDKDDRTIKAVNLCREKLLLLQSGQSTPVDIALSS